MSRTDVENCDHVSLSVDLSHEEQVQHKQVIYLLTPKKPAVDLSASSNSDHYSVDKDDNKEDDLPTWNLSTTDYNKRWN